jgi:rhodanese-related sulfurtransferase
MTLKRITPEEANQLLGEGYQYLDVRTEAEWAAGHPRGAFNIPVSFAGAGGDAQRSFRQRGRRCLKNAKLVIGCKAGGRSMKAANLLIAAGFSDVVDQRAGYDGARDSFGGSPMSVIEKGLTEETAAYAESATIATYKPRP